MKKSCMKKTARLIGGAFAAALDALALFSCQNLSEGGGSSSKNSYPVVCFKAGMQAGLAASPQEISDLVSAGGQTAAALGDGLSRSAAPDVKATDDPNGGVKYYIEAVAGTKGTDSYKRHFVYGTSSTLELGLESGTTWSVTCGIGEVEADASPNGEVAAGVKTVYMAENDPSVAISPETPVYFKGTSKNFSFSR